MSADVTTTRQARLRIDLLGRFQVSVDGTAISADAWRRDRGAALVKLLAVTPGHRLHREQAMNLFWPDLDHEAAGANLRKAVHFARKSLGVPEAVEFGNETIALAADATIDIERFEAAAKVALREPSPEACGKVVDLYRGELLPDDRYVDWIEELRQKIKQRYASVLRAGRLWERLIELDPADEPAQVALMQSALDTGNRGEAIRLFQHLRERLRVDMGVGPGRDAVALYERALAAPAVEPTSAIDRMRASLAWGLIHLHSGDFAKAESIARETRTLALGAGLAREMGEATALLGMVAHMQGQWRELFRVEFADWIRQGPHFASPVFDGHLCLAEFCLASRESHAQMDASARELLDIAEREGSDAGRGLAKLILGEAALFAGRLDEAEPLLSEAEQNHAQAGGASGRVLAIERMAQIALARDQKWKARRLAQRGFNIASTTWLSPHLTVRMSALAVQAARTSEHALAAIRQADQTLADGPVCQPCSVAYRTAAAIALAEAGEEEQVDRRLDELERLVGMWNGGPWVAALWEARGVAQQAKGNGERAAALLTEAAARFADLGRVVDQARCLARIVVPA
jgi:DNA-binding SARP family transcriptional activator